MGAFVSNKPVHVTVDSKPDEYIAIIPKLGAGARADLQNKLLSIKGGEGEGADMKADISFNAGLYNMLLLEAGVVGWKLRGDPDCGIALDAEGCVPFKYEHIRSLDLDDELVDAALGELAKRNPMSGKPPKPSATA